MTMLFSVAVMASAAAPQTAQQCKLTPNTDFMGNDLLCSAKIGACANAIVGRPSPQP